MKKIWLISGFLLACCSLLRAQVLQPAEWIWYSDRLEVGIGGEVKIFFEAELEEGWYLYASNLDPELGPMPATFQFKPHSSYALIGETESINPKQQYDPIWEGEISYFEGKALFMQRIRILEPQPQIRGSFRYQVCSKESGKCINGEALFEVDPLRIIGAAPSRRKGAAAGEAPAAEQPAESPAGPEEVDAALSTAVDTGRKGAAETAVRRENRTVGVDKEKTGAVDTVDAGSSEEQDEVKAGGGEKLLSFALLAFLGGLAALLTPCVFPMIPLTVSYFSFKDKEEERPLRRLQMPLLFGLSVILIYTLAGTLLAWINGPAFANWLSTHWLPNLFFFAVFVLFALSFLGMFELRLPSAWINRADRRADKGGALGMFFMAFTLVLVSFSCTGPIVGALLVASAGGEVLLPVVGMASFALAFALPFTLLALFPQWLQKLPGSGSWLNSVKVVLGFLELALALKFLSLADQVYHWNILGRELYLALWIVIFSCMGLYLLGRLRLSGADALESIGIPRLLLAMLTFAFVVYLLPGMFGAPLPALSGYLPPQGAGNYQLASYQGTGGNSGKAGGASPGRRESLCDEPLYGDQLHWPHGLQGYFELEQALACAREQQKPLFIAFTGHGCVNCREMEARVWSDPRVLQQLQQDFVLLALYVDEKKELPEKDWYQSEHDGRLKKTMGMQNADFQISRFGNNAQPYYVILDPESRESLAAPQAYELDPVKFIHFLETGKRAYRSERQLSSSKGTTGFPAFPLGTGIL